MGDDDQLDRAQRGLGDMDPEDFRRAGHQVVDLVADYLSQLESYEVLPKITPGVIRGELGGPPPASPVPLARILADYKRWIEPNITHWQHPGFMAYFCAVASGPGILGEWLSAGLNSNVMFWRNAPASTEVEEVVVDWLRAALGLPEAFDGMLTDTASISTLTSLVAARHAVVGLEARDLGLAGRPELGRLRIYCSTEAHSSVEKAAIVIGVGHQGVRRIEVDDRRRMRPDRLEAAIAEDRADGWWPICVVATLGTTSSTSVDPVGPVADVCEREGGIWLHVDAAYAGSAALAPELRPRLGPWERADSIVVNPHKWMFTPLDASLLLFRRPDVFRQAFSLVPEYLRVKREGEAHDYHEYGIQLGRRFRALKLWVMLRYFGTEGFAARIREHCRLAGLFAGWVEQTPGWQRLAPVPFSTVCFRHRPEPMSAEQLDAHNEAILERVNASGDVMLSHTKLDGAYTLRVTLGNPRATETHLARCWELLQAAAQEAVISPVT